MNLFYQILSLQLLIFWMDYQKFAANLDYVFYVFFYNITNVTGIVTFDTFTLTRCLLVPYAYVSIKSINYILFSSFELKSILLISSAETLWLSLLNLCCVFNITLLFFYEFFMIFFKTIYVLSIYDYLYFIFYR